MPSRSKAAALNGYQEMSSDVFDSKPFRSPELFAAIGQVAIASAEADHTLTRVLEEIASVNDHSWILFRGQSTTWLIGSIVELIKFGGAPIGATADDAASLQGLVKRLDELHNYRNTVIHGVWSTGPRWGELDDDEPEWRPRRRWWGDRDDEQVIYCHRTRLRKIPPDQQMTISDVEYLAELIGIVDHQLKQAMREISERSRPN